VVVEVVQEANLQAKVQLDILAAVAAQEAAQVVRQEQQLAALVVDLVLQDQMVTKYFQGKPP
jgi:hypothetical protein